MMEIGYEKYSKSFSRIPELLNPFFPVRTLIEENAG